MCGLIRSRQFSVDRSQETCPVKYRAECQVCHNGDHGIDHGIDQGCVCGNGQERLDGGRGLIRIGCQDRVPYIFERRLEYAVEAETGNRGDCCPLKDVNSFMIMRYLGDLMRNKTDDQADNQLGMKVLGADCEKPPRMSASERPTAPARPP